MSLKVNGAEATPRRRLGRAPEAFAATLKQLGQALIYRTAPEVGRRLLYTYFNRRIPNLRSPSSFNEKVNWRILNDRRDLLDWTCDKLRMKQHALAASPIVKVPKTLWSGRDVRELRELQLPPTWVIKPNHRSGLVHFGTGAPDVAQLEFITEGWLEEFESSAKGEWAYERARPMFLVEEMLGVSGVPPSDYKFFVFDGHVRLIQVDASRFTGHARRLYSVDWEPLEVSYGPYALAPIIRRPTEFLAMVSCAEDIGRLFDFIRVDLYAIEGSVFFGEVTPYPGGGLDRFHPQRFDKELGRHWCLPGNNQGAHSR